MKKTRSATLLGHQSHLISVEASFTRGLPSFSIVGLASSAIQESKERVKSALLSNSFNFPPKRITLNLSPSDLNKDGTQFDLPIALLIALYETKIDLSEWTIFGELGLDGRVKENSTLFAQILSLAASHPGAKVLVPQESIEKLSFIQDLEIFPVSTLKEAMDFFKGERSIAPLPVTNLDHAHLLINNEKYLYEDQFELDFNEVKGQEIAKRAALIAAAGGHNLLLEGNPGSGKSMIAKRLHAILPPLLKKEVLEIAKLHSLEGKPVQIAAKRPFRSPHHSATLAAIFGGGSRQAMIGEAGLAHKGILFFDEVPHFSKQVLEALREPLEDKKIRISRVHSKTEYETDFLFVAAMNPCPCGNLLSHSKVCRCSDSEIKRYKNRLSDPFLDRIDLYVTMQENLPEDKSSFTSSQMQKKVFDAFTQMKQREQSVLNAHIPDKTLDHFCFLKPESQEILDQAITRFALSARAINKTKKVARTIADLDQASQIEPFHLLEALSFRKR